jgi:hypothetical protein
MGYEEDMETLGHIARTYDLACLGRATSDLISRDHHRQDSRETDEDVLRRVFREHKEIKELLFNYRPPEYYSDWNMVEALSEILARKKLARKARKRS